MLHLEIIEKHGLTANVSRADAIAADLDGPHRLRGALARFIRFALRKTQLARRKIRNDAHPAVARLQRTRRRLKDTLTRVQYAEGDLDLALVDPGMCGDAIGLAEARRETKTQIARDRGVTPSRTDPDHQRALTPGRDRRQSRGTIRGEHVFRRSDANRDVVVFVVREDRDGRFFSARGQCPGEPASKEKQ